MFSSLYHYDAPEFAFCEESEIIEWKININEGIDLMDRLHENIRLFLGDCFTDFDQIMHDLFELRNYLLDVVPISFYEYSALSEVSPDDCWYKYLILVYNVIVMYLKEVDPTSDQKHYILNFAWFFYILTDREDEYLKDNARSLFMYCMNNFHIDKPDDYTVLFQNIQVENFLRSIRIKEVE